MKYLENYNLSEEDIKEIISKIDYSDTLELDIQKDKVCEILNYLKSKNITNFKEILIHKTHIFYASIDYIKRKLDSVNKEVLSKINDDVTVLDDLV